MFTSGWQIFLCRDFALSFSKRKLIITDKTLLIFATVDVYKDTVVPRKQPGLVLFGQILNMENCAVPVKGPDEEITPLLLQPAPNSNDQSLVIDCSERNKRIPRLTFNKPHRDFSELYKKKDIFLRNKKISPSRIFYVKRGTAQYVR